MLALSCFKWQVKTEPPRHISISSSLRVQRWARCSKACLYLEALRVLRQAGWSPESRSLIPAWKTNQPESVQWEQRACIRDAPNATHLVDTGPFHWLQLVHLSAQYSQFLRWKRRWPPNPMSWEKQDEWRLIISPKDHMKDQRNRKAVCQVFLLYCKGCLVAVDDALIVFSRDSWHWVNNRCTFHLLFYPPPSYILIYLSFRHGTALLKHLFHILACMMWILSGYSLRPQAPALLTILGPLNFCQPWACTVLDLLPAKSLPLTSHVSAYFLLSGRHISLASLLARYPSQHRTLEISHEHVWSFEHHPTRLLGCTLRKGNNCYL